MTETTRERILTFNDPYQMRVNRDLAMEIGLDDSMMLLQLEYLITISDHEIEGRRWTYQTYQGLVDGHFPFWSTAKVCRIIERLEKRRLITIGNFNRLGYDRTQWYALNPEGIATLRSIAIFQNEKCISHSEKSMLQNARIQPREMRNGSARNETAIPETSTKTSTETEPSSAPVVADFGEDTGLDAFKDRPEIHTLVGLLAMLVERNTHRHRRPGKRWYEACRLLLDHDGVSPTEAERVMRWATQDEFWRTNILSFPKFRAQFDQLKLKMERDEGYKPETFGDVQYGGKI